MRLKIRILSLLCIFLLNPGFSFPNPTQVEEPQLVLSPSDKEALERLKVDISNLTDIQDYMKTDAFLLRFLKAAKWKPIDALKMVQEMIAWRTDRRMNDIVNEGFDNFAKDYAIKTSGLDKKGRVIFEIPNLGKWNIATAITQNSLERLARYCIQQFEIATRKLREHQGTHGSAEPSAIVGLVNLKGLNSNDTVCPACFTFFTHLSEVYERYYPLTVGELIIVNTPKEFYELIRVSTDTVFNKHTQDIIKIYEDDHDQSKWKAYIKEHFELNQIDHVFGEEEVPGPKASAKRHQTPKHSFISHL